MPISSDRILFQDDTLLAVNKLSGELVVKGSGKVQKLPLFDFLKKDHPDLQVLHRIDFETSGVILFAHSKEIANTIIDSNFQGWKKVYRTLVMGRINRKQGVIRKPLPARGKGTVEALSKYRVLERFANSSYIEVEIETGRHHQIRRHFAGIGHPLVCDAVYGHKKFNQLFARELGFRKFFLHASRLEIPHPATGKKLVIDAPMPKPFEAVLKKLRSI